MLERKVRSLRLRAAKEERHAPTMFCVTEAETAAIRAAFNEGGELSAAVELRRTFPGVSMERARECARIIAGWQPIVIPPLSGKVTKLRP